MPDLDEFGGVAVAEPTTDEFGGVAVEDQAAPFSLADIKLNPYEQAALRGRPESQFTPHPEEIIPAMKAAITLPGDVLGLVGRELVDFPAQIKNRLTGAPPGSPAYVIPPSELPRPQLPTVEEGTIAPNQTALQSVAAVGNVLSRTYQNLLPVFAPPEVGMTMPLIGGEGALSRAVLAYFGVSQLGELPADVRNAVQVYEDPNASVQAKIEAASQPAVKAAISAMMLHGAARGPAQLPPVPEPEFQGPLATGRVLVQPPGGLPPRVEPPPGLELATPEEQAAALRGSYRQTASYEPPTRLPKPEVPEYTPLAEDARSLGLDTINKVLDHYPELQGNREAARGIRDLAFPEKKGTGEVPGARAATRAVKEQTSGIVGEPTTSLSPEAESALQAALKNLPGPKPPPEPPAPASVPEPEPKPPAAPPTAAAEPVPTKPGGVSSFIARLDDPTLSNGTEAAHQAGLQVTSLADLDALAQKRFAIETAAYKAKEAGDMNTFVRLLSGIVQLPNEAIQAALNIGGAQEGAGTIPTKLGARPLDIATHPEAAEWLRNNWKALKLPEAAIPEALREIKPETKPPVSETKPPVAATEPVKPATVTPEPVIAAPVAQAAAEVKKVAAVEGQKPAKAVKSELVSRLETAIENAPTEAESKPIRYTLVNGQQRITEGTKGTVTIEIPGDGTFTVPNTKEALSTVLDRARRISTGQGKLSKLPTEDPGKVGEQAKKVIAAYGSPEAAYQSVKRQQAELQAQEPPPGTQEREVWNQQIANAQALSEQIYHDTKAAAAETRAQALRSQIDTYREGQEGFEKEIARVLKKKRQTTSDKVALQQFNERLAENKARVAKWEKEVAQLDEQAKQEKAALEQIAKPAKPTVPAAAKPTTPAAAPKWTRATEGPVTGESAFISLAPLQDLFDKVEPAVRRAFGAIRELGREAGKIKHLTDYRRAVLNWSAKLQRSFGEAAEAQKEINTRVPDPIRQDAVTNWIQADGDAAVLRQRLAATRAWRDPVTGKPHPMAKRLIAGYEAALNLTPEETAVANDAKAAYAALGARGQAYNVLRSFKDNYVTQIWNLAKSPFGQGLGGRTLKERFRFSRASTFPTFFDGEQAGFVPKTKEIGKLLPVYLHEMNTVIAARQLVAEMARGTASDGRPLLSPRGVGVPIDDPASGEREATLVMPKVAKGDTRDYRVMSNQPALQDWRWAATDPESGAPTFLKADLAVHPEAYARLNAVLGRSALREWYSTRTSAMAQIPKTIVRGLDAANATTKRTMLGLASLFHQVQEGTHAIGHRVNPFFGIPKIDLVRNAAQMDASRHGLMLLPDRASENQFMEGFRASGLVSKIPIIGPIADFYSNYLFHEYIPGLKYKTYEAILDRNQKVYAADLAAGRVTPGDVKTLSAEQANAAYGHLNYADLGRNPTVQHLAQLFTLAPDFWEARARFTGQAITGLTGAKVGREQLLALGALALAQAAGAYTAAKITGGQWDVKRPFEFTLGPRRYTLRSVPEDISSLIHNARIYFHSRLSPIVGKGALQYASGVDYLGRKVSAGETTKELAQQPIPISIRGFLGIGKSSLTGLEQLAGAVGLKISRHSISQDVNDMARDWMRTSGEPKAFHKYELAQQQEFGESDYGPLRKALADDDLERASKAYDRLLAEGKSRKTIFQTIRPYHITETPGGSARHDKPVAGLTLAEQRRFLSTLTPEQRKVYEADRAEKVRQFRKFQELLRQREAQQPE